MRKIRVEKLTEQAFAPLGQLITTQGRPYGGEEGMYRWYEKQAQIDGAQTVSVNLLTAIERPFVCRKFESHKRTGEVILPLTGGLVVAGIPQGEPTIERLRAFYVPVGMGIAWAPQAWHYAPYPIGQDALCAIIFRHGTGGDDAIFAELAEEVGFEL